MVVAAIGLFAVNAFRAPRPQAQSPRDQLVGCGFAGGRARGFAGRGVAAGLLGCSVTVTGFGLWSSAAPVTASTPMPTTPPTSTLPANPAAPDPATSLVRRTTCG